MKMQKAIELIFPWHRSCRRMSAWGGFLYPLTGKIKKQVILQRNPQAVYYAVTAGEYFLTWGELWGRTTRSTGTILRVSEPGVEFVGVVRMPEEYCDELATSLDAFLEEKTPGIVKLDPDLLWELAREAEESKGPLEYELDDVESGIVGYMQKNKAPVWINDLTKALGRKRGISMSVKISRLLIYGYIGTYVGYKQNAFRKIITPRLYPAAEVEICEPIRCVR